MKIDRSAIFFGVFFGAIAFIICLFFLPPYIALLFAAFTATLYTVVLSIALNRAAKKHDGDAEIVGRDILLSVNANYYSGKGVCNGMLYLTEDSVIFISHEKKPAMIEEMSLNSIKDASCGKRHAAEMQIVTDDGVERRFIGPAVSDFAFQLNALRNFEHGILPYLKGKGCDLIQVEKDVDDTLGMTEDYERLLAQWKPEGFTPLIIVPSEILCENVDEALLPKDEIIKSSNAINAAEFLKERIAEAMPCGEDSGYDIMGEFVDCEPVTLFNSLVGRETGPDGDIIIAKIPTVNPWELAAWIPMGGWNECPAPEEQVAVFKYWYEKYGAIPAVVCGDTWEMYVERPPATTDEAAALALEQFGFCGDIVWQGAEKVNALASTLVNSKVWYFWWD